MKRFNWKSFDFGPELELDSKLGIKYEKPNINKEQSSNTEIKMRNSFNFYDEIAPKTIEDLAVHSKKIEDVQKWLILNVLNQEMKNKFLLLSGPSGSAKTTTLKVLCKKLSISVLEWVNPTDKVDEPFKRTSQMKRFMEFLIDSKWNPLFESENSKKITFVKDFPNAVIYHPEEFFNVLNECYKLKYPIVFICTGANGNATNLLRTLFNEDIVNKFNIVHIRVMNYTKCMSAIELLTELKY
ncbi:cell cycle checkpoint protein RAD17 [Anoplophora glabripennis]|uniref:cell cycle checkpoint protein RAD17 n=1 Tax=Anoplophora glabripennis TaxID=217634 RepID=UPI000C780058|nr:cell cycle checkpoint protein RAD17 [Anoplophora glabripennis]